MAHDYPFLYPHTHGDAVRLHETELWERSFRENVACARTIEKALRSEYDKTGSIPSDCAAKVLAEYGFKRVNHVLVYTVKDLEKTSILRPDFSDDTFAWANKANVMLDAAYGRYYCVDTADVLLDQFIRQTMEAYQALGLFGGEHCAHGMYDEDVKGKVLVMKPSTLKEECWSQENQLWLATGGFGCDPKGRGRAIFATCLSDGEQTRWNREDFAGVLDERYLPEWAQEKLAALRAPKQEQAAAPAMGGMEMR